MSFAGVRIALSRRKSLADWGRVYLSIGPVGIVLGVFFAVLAHFFSAFEKRSPSAGFLPRWPCCSRPYAWPSYRAP